MELKRKRSKKKRNDKGTICQMWEKRYNRRKSNRTREREILCLECKTGKKKPWWNWEMAMHSQRVQKAQ